MRVDHRRRHLRLPAQGILLVSSDLHGNGGDYQRLESIFLSYLQAGKDIFWLLLGDVVHGPDERSRLEEPELYDYDDESILIILRLTSLMRRFPRRVYLLMGNHEFAHLGGPRPRKFYDDEATHLEQQLSFAQKELMRGLFKSALLAASSPSGLLFTHGAPNETLCHLDTLNMINFPPRSHDHAEAHLLRGLLWAYGQPDEVIQKVLAQCSQAYPESPLKWLIHGHDKDEQGWFTEGERQLCIVSSFGAKKQHKRYLLLNLETYYDKLSDLTVPQRLKYLYPKGGDNVESLVLDIW